MIGDTTVQRPGKVPGWYDEKKYLGPDHEAFVLGGDPNYAGNFANQANQRAGVASNEQNFVRGDAGMADITARNRAGEAYGRANPAAAELGRSAATGAEQGNLAGRLRAFAEAPEGPSAAQAQLQRGTNQAMASQLAIARGGSGFGESASSLSRAGQNAAGIVANAATSAAQLRADEYARNQDRRLQAYGLSGDVLGQQRQGTMAEGGLQLDAQQARDAAALGYMQESRANNQLESDASMRGLQGSLDAQGMGLQAEQAALGGRVQREQALSDLYQAELQDVQEHRRQDRARDKDWVDAASGVVSSIGGAFLSDIRAKTRIETLDSPARYGDPSGDYYALADQNFSMQAKRDARAARAERNRGEEDGGGGFAALLGKLSDEKTKKNVKPSGSDYSGIGKYEFEYKDPERHGKGRFQGPMAHELRSIPGVTFNTPDGEAVDPDRLSLSNASELGSLRREVELLKRSR